MSKLWKFNLLLLAVIAVVLLMMNKPEPEEEPVAEAAADPAPSVVVLNEAERIFGYTSAGPAKPGESELLHLTKALTVKNPHDYPVTIGEISTRIFDSAGEELSYTTAEDLFWASARRTLQPGETAHLAATDLVPELSFREDYGHSESEWNVYREDGADPYTLLDVSEIAYRFEEADPGNTWLKVEALFGNSSSINVDTTEVAAVVEFYDHNGTLIGGDTAAALTSRLERIRPGEQKRIAFDAALIGREFSQDIGAVKIYAGCDRCRAR